MIILCENENKDNKINNLENKYNQLLEELNFKKDKDINLIYESEDEGNKRENKFKI